METKELQKVLDHQEDKVKVISTNEVDVTPRGIFSSLTKAKDFIKEETKGLKIVEVGFNDSKFIRFEVYAVSDENLLNPLFTSKEYGFNY